MSLIFAFALSFAHAALPTDMAKSPDGKTVYCAAAADVGTDAYRPHDYSAKATGTTVTLSFTIDSLRCAAVAGGGFAFIPRNFYDLQPGVDNKGNPVPVTVQDLEVVLRNQTADVLGIQTVALATSETFSFYFPSEKILTPSDIATIKSGTPVTKSTEFFLRGDYTVQTPMGPFPLGQRAGGSYYADVEITRAP